MRLRDFIDGLSKDEQDDYARRCGTTGNYLRVHIRYGKKECRRELRESLAAESNGHVSLEDVLDHFGMLPSSV